MTNVLITGGTGFIGAALTRRLLEAGHRVTLLSRSGRQASPGPRYRQYTPEVPGDWMAEAGKHEVIVHLAGERAVGVRYTEAMKARIRDSRTRSTELLVRAMADARSRPRVFLCASAIGYYGSALGTEPVDESSPAGSDFLAGVTVAWEQAARAAAALGVRVASLRFGVVLGRGGGALGALLRPFQFFAGGPIGSGRQAVSWVHLEDAVRAVLLCAEDERAEGPVNITAPEPVSNAELVRNIAERLGQRAWLRVPSFALRAAFGEGAEPLLGGRAVLPRRLEALGFAWKFPRLRQALADLLP